MLTTDYEGNEIGKLFVGGLSQNTTDTSLRTYFSRYGEIEDASVMIDSKTGRSRGFGYVQFRNAWSVSRVLADKFHCIDDKEIDTQQCNVKMKGRNRRNLKIFVGGIGMDQTSDSIRSFFEKFGRVTDVNLLMDPVKPKHRGFAFIGFEDEKTVARLINMHYLIIGNKKVEIKAMEPLSHAQKGNSNSDYTNSEFCFLKDSGIKSASRGIKEVSPQNKQNIPRLDGDLLKFSPITPINPPQLSIPENINPTSWGYSNGFIPFCPHFCPGCYSFSYQIYQSHFNTGCFPPPPLNFTSHQLEDSMSGRQKSLLGDPPCCYTQNLSDLPLLTPAKACGDNRDREELRPSSIDDRMVSPMPTLDGMPQLLPSPSIRYSFPAECSLFGQNTNASVSLSTQDPNFDSDFEERGKHFDHEMLINGASDCFIKSESRADIERREMSAGDRFSELFKDFDL